MPDFLIILSAVVVFLSLIVMDITRKLRLFNKVFLGIFFIIAPHIIIITHLYSKYAGFGRYGTAKWLVSVLFILFVSYVWIKFNISPVSGRQLVRLRLRIMFAGRTLILYGLYAAVMQTLLYLSGVITAGSVTAANSLFIADTILTVVSIAFLFINGTARILFTSRRLHILKRILMYIMVFIPGVNVFVLLYICHIASMEYDHECYKVMKNDARAESEVCKTRYPLVLVHGVGFRDLKYINYWGRIPRELIRNGAAIYYGNQEAWGTVAYNAEDIKLKVLDIVRSTGCGKVNIIAHSKGGLDARYMISKLDMGEYVASLTTMSSPHRGCRFVDLACKLPDRVYKAIAGFFDRRFKTFGDKNPDFYTASRQFSTEHSRKFNEEVKDVDQVYYQSYASVMKNSFSDYILTVPYLLARITDGENDGLVSVESAKWGKFRGVLRNRYRRGISHGDLIDLRRDDYKGFDIIEKYVNIVSELKASDF